MSKIMLINVTHAEENRVGIVEDGQLESFEIESFSREHLKGNIYKGIVRRIHPAIEAAFVDIGAERDAFLPLDEICFRNLPSGRNGSAAEKGRRRIKEVLKSGDEVLVQIIKEQFTNKPPTLSTFYSLPGRYLVLLPGSEEAGISRKIEGEERLRVREMVGRLTPPPGCGIIVRTAAGFDEEQGELERDLAYLQRLWESIRKHAETRRAPALIYREHDLVLRNIRDYFTPDINEIFIDNDEVCERARDFLHNVMPGKEHLLHLYQGEQPIFSRFGVEAQIESIYKRRVQLKSGGSIVIDGTEALTAIDVNSGGSMRGASQEETAYKTNLEAAAEIARQLRLRDLGGIIVIDFIDMRTPSHIAEVERTLRDAMRPDKARHDIGRISRLGLLEVSRQRLRPAAAASSYTACPMCEGHGAIRTTESAALVVLRKIHNRIAEGDVAQTKVSLPRDVAMYLLNQKRDDLAVLETRYAASITVVVSDRLMPHQSEIEIRTRDTSERAVPVVRPGEVAVETAPPSDGAMRAASGGRTAAESTPPSPIRGPARRAPARPGLATGTEESRARRRRRRGGRGRRDEAGAPGSDQPMVDSMASSAREVPRDDGDVPDHPAAESETPWLVTGAESGSPAAAVTGTETDQTTAREPLTIDRDHATFTEQREFEVAGAPPESEAARTDDLPAVPEPVSDAGTEASWAWSGDEGLGTAGLSAPERFSSAEPSEVGEPHGDAASGAAEAGPSEQPPDAAPAAAPVAPGRRRRRRGGRRGGRGRRVGAEHPEGARDYTGDPGEPREFAAEGSPATRAEEGHTPQEAPSASPGTSEGAPPRRRRGRRGGRGRRTGVARAGTSVEGTPEPAETTPPATAAAGPVEPVSET